MKEYFKIEAFTKAGQRENNEDNIFPDLDQDYSDGEIRNLFLVCDGMGGHEKGEVASDIICTQMSKYFIDNKIELSNEDTIKQGLQFVEKKFDAFLIDNETAAGMGSTMTLLHLHSHGAILAHVGDSRIYQIRNGEIIYVTKDHSYVQTLLDSGVINTEEEAREHPEKNVILQAVCGASQKVAKPSIKLLTDLKEDDIFFLCSDGVTESYSDRELAQVFQSMPTIEAITAKIIQKCNKESSDNFSAILVQLTPEYIASLSIPTNTVEQVEDIVEKSKTTSTQIVNPIDETENEQKISEEEMKPSSTKTQIVNEEKDLPQSEDAIVESKSKTQIFSKSLTENETEEKQKKEGSEINSALPISETVEEFTTEAPVIDNLQKEEVLSSKTEEHQTGKVESSTAQNSIKERKIISHASNEVAAIPNPVYDSPPKSNLLKYILIGLIVLVLASAAYYFMKAKNNKPEETEYKSEISKTNSELNNQNNGSNDNSLSTQDRQVVSTSEKRGNGAEAITEVSNNFPPTTASSGREKVKPDIIVDNPKIDELKIAINKGKIDQAKIIIAGLNINLLNDVDKKIIVELKGKLKTLNDAKEKVTGDNKIKVDKKDVSEPKKRQAAAKAKEDSIIKANQQGLN